MGRVDTHTHTPKRMGVYMCNYLHSSENRVLW